MRPAKKNEMFSFENAILGKNKMRVCPLYSANIKHGNSYVRGKKKRLVLVVIYVMYGKGKGKKKKDSCVSKIIR